MSENTTAVTLDGDALKNYTAYLEAQKIAEAKKEAARVARIRANNRPVDAQGEEKPASLSFVHVLADLIEAFTVTYANDPAMGMKRLADEVLPNVRTMGNTDRKLAGVTFDVKRKELVGMTPPDGAVAPAPKSDGK